MNEMEEIFGEVISSYSRAQAIDDGVLVDLTKWASNGPDGMLGGFTCPLACTSSVWADINSIPLSAVGIQDVRGRAHDVIGMAAFAARRNSERSECLYQLTMGIRGDRKKLRTYKLVAGPGDDGELVMTIMQPEED